jgi:uncharacterized membrane protein YqgA involved in biofilm formation
MIFLGALVNAAAIVVGSLIGTFVFKSVPERFSELAMKGIAVTVVFIGIRGAMQNENILLLIISITVGSIIGELINIDKGMNKLGALMETKFGTEGGTFSKGFVSATILFCVGAMAIVGSLESGLTGTHETLFVKSVIDGFVSIILASKFGIGVMFSAFPLLLYQGSIAGGAALVSGWLTDYIIREMAAVGGLLIALIGFNVLGIKEVKVANMIPAIFLPWAYFAIMGLIAG